MVRAHARDTHEAAVLRPGWLFERNLDGVRTIAGRVDDEVTLWPRSHLSMNQMYPELVEAFDRTGPERFVADGEIVAFEGRQTSFAQLQPRGST